MQDTTSGTGAAPAEFVTAPETLRVGTLRYTRLSLLTLFGMLYMGVFAMTSVNMVVPNLVPIFLKQMDLSNAVIGILIGTIPFSINIVVNPVISFRSDRSRTRFGRRMPYIMVGIPGVSAILIAMGLLILFAPEWSFRLAAWLTPAQMTIAAMAFFMIALQVFINSGLSVFFYLFADVVPGKVIGRFMAIYMLFNACGAFFFSYVMMPLAKTNMPLVFIAEGVLLLAVFAVIVFGVKEGGYPPPPRREAAKNAALRDGAVFLRECFGIPFYVLVFAGFAINDVSTICRALFSSLYAQELGMSLDQYGVVLSYGTIIWAVLSLPLSLVIDRLTPLRVYMLGSGVIVLVNIWSFLFVRDTRTFTLACVFAALVYALQMASQLPSYVALFPKERYGQFCAANAIFSTALLAAFSYGGGQFIDLMGGDYRYMYLWDAVFTLTGLLVLVAVYRQWKSRGGPNHFTPPQSGGNFEGGGK